MQKRYGTSDGAPADDAVVIRLSGHCLNLFLCWLVSSSVSLLWSFWALGHAVSPEESAAGEGCASAVASAS